MGRGSSELLYGAPVARQNQSAPGPVSLGELGSRYALVVPVLENLRDRKVEGFMASYVAKWIKTVHPNNGLLVTDVADLLDELVEQDLLNRTYSYCCPRSGNVIKRSDQLPDPENDESIKCSDCEQRAMNSITGLVKGHHVLDEIKVETRYSVLADCATS